LGIAHHAKIYAFQPKLPQKGHMQAKPAVAYGLNFGNFDRDLTFQLCAGTSAVDVVDGARS
jgi:hypothetical protein